MNMCLGVSCVIAITSSCSSIHNSHHFVCITFPEVKHNYSGQNIDLVVVDENRCGTVAICPSAANMLQAMPLSCKEKVLTNSP